MEKDRKNIFRVVDGDPREEPQGGPQKEDKQQRRRRLRMSPRRMLPAILTLLAMSLGFTSLIWAKAGNYEAALILIVVAAVLDGLDGRVARLVKGDSRFGAELDSFADFLNFGVAPAFIMWLWGFQAMGNLGVVMAFFFAMCCALRLARFNASLTEDDDALNDRYFSGVPAPAGGLLVMAPMMIDVVVPGSKEIVGLTPLFMVGVSLLMVSKVPTFSLKAVKLRIPRRNFVPILLATVVSGMMIFNFPRAALLIAAAVYLGSLPVSVARYYREKSALKKNDILKE